MGKKAKFIDKNDPNTRTYRLVHRSQRDPLAADPDAPQLVLQPNPTHKQRREQVEYPEIELEDDEDLQDGKEGDEPLPGINPRTAEKFAKKAALVEAGVYFGDDDDYDYSQHLKEPGLPGTEFIAADESALKTVLISRSKGAAGDADERVEFGLPASVFASKKEQSVGLLNLTSAKTLPLDWDPDIIAALDDALDPEDPQNILDDDFILKANAEDDDHQGDDGDDDGDWEDEEDDEDWEDEDGDEDFGSENEDEFDEQDLEGAVVSKRSISFKGVHKSKNPEQEDVKSRFTEYSMTSSILPRSELLQVQDDRFEKLFEEYDDEKIGALDEEYGQEEDDHVGLRDLADYEEVIQEHFKELQTELIPFMRGVRIGKRKPQQPLASRDEVDAEEVRTLAPVPLDSQAEAEIETEPEPDEIEEPFNVETVIQTLYPKKVVRDHDCESIISTKSNIYNHPTKISEPRRQKAKPATESSEVKPEISNDSEESSGSESGEDELVSVSGSVSQRNKNETAEEKKARKKLVKQERRDRRVAKKATKDAFKQEKLRQERMHTVATSFVQILK